MRLFPIALIVIGSLGLAKYLGLIPVGAMSLIGPLLLVAFGVALLLRRPGRCRSGGRYRDNIGDTPSLPSAKPQ